MKRLLIACSTAAIGVASTLHISAHHSFTAEYDIKKPISMTGTVTSVEWQNPHTWFYIDVKDPQGQVVNWAIEGGAPTVLYREGWKPTSLKVGDQVTVTVALAKDKSKKGNAYLVKLPDGRCVFAGSSGPGGTASDNCTPGRR
jgi:Family of unknown function (DUF6152)